MLPGVILQKPYLTSMLVLLWRGGWTRWHPRGLSNLHSFTVLYDTHKRKVRLCFPWRCNSRYDSPKNLKSYKRWQLQDLLQHVLYLSNPIIPGPVSIGRGTAKSTAGDGDPQNVVRGVISRQDSLISAQCAEIQPSVWAQPAVLVPCHVAICVREGLAVLQPWHQTLFMFFLKKWWGPRKTHLAEAVSHRNIVDRPRPTCLLRLSTEEEAKDTRGFICLWLFLD